MCVIIVKPRGIKAPEVPEWVVRSNGDGFGVAIVTFGQHSTIRVVKSLVFDKVCREWLSAPEDSTAVLHLRAASAGERSTRNCHPHKITRFLYLFHNGHVSSVSRKPRESDTRALARHMRKLGVTSLKMAREFLSRLFPSERFVLVSPRGASLIGDFYEEDGCYVNRRGALKELKVSVPVYAGYHYYYGAGYGNYYGEHHDGYYGRYYAGGKMTCEMCDSVRSWKNICYDPTLRAYLCRECYRELLQERFK